MKENNKTFLNIQICSLKSLSILFLLNLLFLLIQFIYFNNLVNDCKIRKVNTETFQDFKKQQQKENQILKDRIDLFYTKFENLKDFIKNIGQ